MTRSLSAAELQSNRAVSFLLSAFCFLLFATPSLRAAERGDSNPAVSPYAQVRPVALKEVHWTVGFWADRFELCRQRTVPALWSIMEGTNYSQFYQNFRIAAGLAEGRHRGGLNALTRGA